MLNKNGTFYLILIGNTERNILDNTDEIIRKSLPTDRVISYYKEVNGASKDVVLGYIHECSENCKLYVISRYR